MSNEHYRNLTNLHSLISGRIDEINKGMILDMYRDKHLLLIDSLHKSLVRLEQAIGGESDKSVRSLIDSIESSVIQLEKLTKKL